MTKTTNLQPASVRARLQDLQRRLFPDIPPNQMLLYAQQGFLARLDASGYADQFVLKGALSLFVRYREAARPTKDIDLAGRGLGQSPDRVAAVMREVCGVPFADGLQFDPQSVTVRPINAALKYPGTAVTLRADLGPPAPCCNSTSHSAMPSRRRPPGSRFRRCCWIRRWGSAFTRSKP